MRWFNVAVFTNRFTFSRFKMKNIQGASCSYQNKIDCINLVTSDNSDEEENKTEFINLVTPDNSDEDNEKCKKKSSNEEDNFSVRLAKGKSKMASAEEKPIMLALLAQRITPPDFTASFLADFAANLPPRFSVQITDELPPNFDDPDAPDDDVEGECIMQ